MSLCGFDPSRSCSCQPDEGVRCHGAVAAADLLKAIDALGFLGCPPQIVQEVAALRLALYGPPKPEPEDAPYGGVPSCFP